jgi:hypothetical protein
VFAGYDADFAEPWVNWPLNDYSNGVHPSELFQRILAVRPGTAAIVRLIVSGGELFPVEFKAYQSSANAPAELRLSIVRVQ